MTIAEEICSSLVANIDEGYRDFHAKLVPTIDPARILGVRLPAQRAVAKAFKKDARLPEFLAMTAHDYVEEINVHGFLAAEILDAEACLAQINHFLPMIDNWANCDALCQSFKQAAKHPAETWEFLMTLRASEEPFTLRVLAVTMLCHFLTDDYIDRVLAVLNETHCDAYYYKMGAAWAAATAMAKYRDKTFAFL